MDDSSIEGGEEEFENNDNSLNETANSLHF